MRDRAKKLATASAMTVVLLAAVLVPGSGDQPTSGKDLVAGVGGGPKSPAMSAPAPTPTPSLVASAP